MRVTVQVQCNMRTHVHVTYFENTFILCQYTRVHVQKTTYKKSSWEIILINLLK